MDGKLSMISKSLRSSDGLFQQPAHFMFVKFETQIKIFSNPTPVRIAAAHRHVAAFLIPDDGAGHL